MIVFVYGTLRPGASQHEKIEQYVQGAIEGMFEGRLFAMPDGRPIVVDGEPAYPVKGDLLFLADSPAVMEELDRIVGVKNPRSLFQRVQRQVLSDSGDNMVLMYLCKSSETHQVLEEGTELEEGDWFLVEEGTRF